MVRDMRAGRHDMEVGGAGEKPEGRPVSIYSVLLQGLGCGMNLLSDRDKALFGSVFLFHGP